jgi:hypothetical protein
MKRVIKYLPVLQVLQSHQIDKKTKQALLQSSQLIRVICECCLNILKGNVKLSKREKSRLKRHRLLLRRLAERKPLKSKQNLLQHGGGAFLPLLLAPIISAITGALAK